MVSPSIMHPQSIGGFANESLIGEKINIMITIIVQNLNVVGLTITISTPPSINNTYSKYINHSFEKSKNYMLKNNNITSSYLSDGGGREWR